MLLGVDVSLRDAIIHLLLEQGGQTYATLQARLTAAGHRYTKQAIYAELNQLISQLVVIKRARCFELRLCWLVELKELLTSRLEATQGVVQANRPPAREEFSCRSLLEAQSVWSALVLEEMLRSGEGCYYEWVQHCWFQLSSERVEEQILKQHIQRGVEYRMVVGTDSRLSRLSLVRMGEVKGGFVFTGSTPSILKNVCLSVLNDSTISVSLPEALVDQMQRFFLEHEQISAKTVQAFRNLATERAALKVVSIRDPERAQRFRAALERECASPSFRPFGSALQSRGVSTDQQNQPTHSRVGARPR